MTEPGSTTPVQPVRSGGGTGRGRARDRPPGGRRPARLAAVVWRDDDARAPDGGGLRRSPRARRSATPTDAAPLPSDLLAVPTVGPWSGRVAAEWSIVAFLRADPVSRDPLDLSQQPVAVFIGAVREPTSGPDAICDAVGTSTRRAAADLPDWRGPVPRHRLPARPDGLRRSRRPGRGGYEPRRAARRARADPRRRGPTSPRRRPARVAVPASTRSGCSGCPAAARGRTASTASTSSRGTGRPPTCTPASGPECRTTLSAAGASPGDRNGPDGPAGRAGAPGERNGYRTVTSPARAPGEPDGASTAMTRLSAAGWCTA